MNYKFKNISINHSDDIAKVFNDTRVTKVKASYFENKFISPTIEPFFGVIAYDSNNYPVSHVGIIPLYLKHKDNLILIGTSADTVTNKDHQRQGLFRRCSNILLEKAKEKNIRIVFRFPNPTTYNGLIKYLSYKHTHSFYTFNFTYDPKIPLIKFLNKFKLFKIRELYFRLVVFMWNKKVIKTLQNSIVKQGLTGIEHDQAFFQHKAFSNSFILKLGSNKIWFKCDDGLLIGDSDIINEGEFFKKLKLFCRLFGIHKVQFNVLKNAKEYDILKKYVSPERGLPVCVKEISKSGINLNDIYFSFADHDDF